MSINSRAGATLLVLGIGFITPVHAQEPSARQLASTCATCHGTNGHSVGGVPPSLAGRNAGELYAAMKDFQSGKRPATIMHQQARGYTDAQLQAISAFFASIPPAPARLPSKP